MKRMPIWEIAIRRLDMPTSRVLIFYVGSAAASGLITAALSVHLEQANLEEGVLPIPSLNYLIVSVKIALYGITSLSINSLITI